jgi:hypothetical protein
MGRKVGARIREVLEAVESGATTKPQIHAKLERPIEPSNLGKYCSRAVGLRLMTVDRSKHPMEFRVEPDWRLKANESGTNKRPARKQYPAPRVNSVFALGAA